MTETDRLIERNRQTNRWRGKQIEVDKSIEKVLEIERQQGRDRDTDRDKARVRLDIQKRV